MPNPLLGVPCFDFGVCSAREVEKHLRSPPCVSNRAVLHGVQTLDSLDSHYHILSKCGGWYETQTADGPTHQLTL